jgi:hypothetical protein
MKFIVIPADPDSEMRIEEVGDKEGFDKAREWVGGYIQLTQVSGYKKLQLCVDEEGQIKNLPFNMRATLIAGIGQHIVGDAVVTGRNFKDVEKAVPELVPLLDAWKRVPR